MGNRNRATAEGTEPENTGRRGTGGRWTKGKNPAGKRETGGKPTGETGGREVRAPNHPVRVRGFGATRIHDAAGRVLAGLGGLRIVVHQFGGQRPSSAARPRRCTAPERQSAPSAVY